MLNEYSEKLTSIFKSHYEQNSDVWTEQTELRSFTLKALDLLSKKQTVLEIGCGRGKDTELLKLNFELTHAIDLHITEEAKALRDENCYVEEISFLDISGSKYDCIFDIGAFHHWPSDLAPLYASKINELLNSKGLFILSLYTRDDVTTFENRIQKDGKFGLLYNCDYLMNTFFPGFELIFKEVLPHPMGPTSYMNLVMRKL
jgi:cyclopropane fatty-acyl-phospholipid synthase-like methyltransferase